MGRASKDDPLEFAIAMIHVNVLHVAHRSRGKLPPESGENSPRFTHFVRLRSDERAQMESIRMVFSREARRPQSESQVLRECVRVVGEYVDGDSADELEDMRRQLRSLVAPKRYIGCSAAHGRSTAKYFVHLSVPEERRWSTIGEAFSMSLVDLARAALAYMFEVYLDTGGIRPNELPHGVEPPGEDIGED